MKKTFIIAILLVLMISLCSCGNKEKETEEAVPGATPEEYLGTYFEPIAGRGSIEVKGNEISLNWSSSAYEHDEISFPTDYDETNKRINYKDAVRTRITYTSETEHTDEVIYEDGTGYFEIGDDKLIWHDDKSESKETVEFVRNVENMINPWTYTTDLNEAIDNSGIKFSPPVSVPDGYELVTYGANINGIIEAQYESDSNRLVIRKSDLYKDIELNGNYNNYSKTWSENFKGLNIDCSGDGESINMALFSYGDFNYSICVFDKNSEKVEGNGISVDELTSIIAGMQ